jgi:hypothetical protein
MGFRAHFLPSKVDVDVNFIDYYLTVFTLLALNTPRTEMNPSVCNIKLITSSRFRTDTFKI